MTALTDERGLSLSTPVPAAREAYVEGVRRLLCAQPGIEPMLDAALVADPNMVVAHIALARAHQVHARGAQARAAAAQALACLDGANERERSHVRALERVVMGDGAGALEQVRAHLARWPRDVMVMVPASGVFGLFGFSGKAGREQALMDFLDPFAKACAEDWWFQYAYGFAQCEVGQIDAARRNIERSLAQRPDNANAAHILAHVHYEAGEDAAGLAALRHWHAGYSRDGFMHGHLAWHMALSALELGDTDTAWALFDAHVQPGGAWGPPLNLLTDSASFLLRAELFGAPRQADRWHALAEYASSHFPQPGLAFADAHAAIVYAMAADEAGLTRLRDQAKGPAADMVSALARGFGAMASGDQVGTLAHLQPLMATHERMGGSRAQRDLLAYVVQRAQQPDRGRSALVRVRPSA